MVLRNFFSSARRPLSLSLAVVICLFLGLAIRNIFSATAAPNAVTAPVPAPSAAPAAALAAAMQTTNNLLSLRFENVLTGDQGEVPVQSASVTFQTGISGQGLYMDRGNRLTYSSEGNVNSTEGTIELWLKPSWNGTDGQNHAIFRYGTSNGYMLLGKEGNVLRMVLNRANENGSLELDVSTDVQSWQADQWHHVAASWSNTGQFIRLYVDGTLASERAFVATLPTISTVTNPTLQIGGDSVRYPLLATIDNVDISDAARSSQEIANRMLTGFIVNSATLTPNLSSIEMYPGWTYWQDFKYTAVASVGTLTVPFVVASLSSSSPAIATVDTLTGRIKAVAPGTATITATYLGQQSVITVNVLTPQKAEAEETVDTYLNTPATGYLYKIPVAIIRYLPTKDGTNLDATTVGYASTLDALHTKQTRVEKKLKFMLEDGSRFRGYGGAIASPSLGYQVVKIINVYEDLPPGLPTSTSGVYFPDYKQIFKRHNVEDLVTKQGVKEIWLEQYVNGRIALNESNMYSLITGDISSSLRTNDDLPAYAKPYTVFGINFVQSENLAARSRGHHLEALLNYATILQDRSDALFQESFIGRTPEGTFQQGRCGKTDIPPNGMGNFDFENGTEVDSDIEDWFPDGRGNHRPINRDAWASLTYNWPETPEGRTEGQWYIYWMQSIPGLDNGITRFDTDRITNWWQFAADWDVAMQSKLGVSESMSCQYALSSTTRNAPGNGTSGSVNVTCGANCKWIATTAESWIKLTNAAGNGNGAVNYTVEPTTVARTGKIIIAEKVFTISQSTVNCLYSLSAVAQNFTASSGTSSVNVTTDTGCTWSASSNANWITVTAGSTGSGNGTVNFTVAANTGPARVGTMTIADQTYTVNQSSGCTFALSATSRSMTVTGGADSVNVTAGTGCVWTAVSNDSWLTISSGNNGTGNGTVAIEVAANPGAARTGTLTIAAITYTVNQASANPAPTLTSLNPNAVTVGSAAFTLTVNGTNFSAASVVNWNGNARTTTFVNTTQLQAAITAADVASTGTANVTVTNPAPGGGTSDTLNFSINNPAPTLTSLNPAAVVAGSAGFTLTLNGSGFVATSTAQVNSVNRTTTFVSSTQLTIPVTAADIANAGALNIVVVNAAPGGGTSGQQLLTINNPTPTLISLSQTSATVGSAEFTLTVNGTNFVGTSKVRWKGADRTTTFVNTTQLTATIPASDLTTVGTADVTVVNPTPGGGITGAITFTINNPLPTLTNLAPNTITAGSSAFSLTVTGTGFVANSVVRWNGSDRTTTFVSGTQLSASITAADIASASTANVTVFNPTPGGGTTSAMSFTITSLCTFALGSSSQNFAAAGGNGSVSVNTGTGCTWTATSNNPWLTINTGSSGTGPASVTFTVAANTGAARTGTLTVAGQTFTVTQDAQATSCVAQRTLPAGYFVGQAFVVSIQVTPAAGTQSYAVEDVPPTGWAVSGIDNGGQFDAVNNKVKWGPFFDAQARTLTYSVTPPVGTTGTKTFAGTASVNGVSSTICGNTSIEASTVFHPADLNDNLKIEINELTAYGAAWKAGTTWSRAPNPIDINYLTNAGLIWKTGEVYHYDGTKSPPFAAGVSIAMLAPNREAQEESPDVVDRLVIPSFSTMSYTPGLEVFAATDATLQMAMQTSDPADAQLSVFINPQVEDSTTTANVFPVAAFEEAPFAGGVAQATFNAAAYAPGVAITVTINVTPDAATQVYAVEDTPPLGWVVSNVGSSGAFDNTNKKVKWGPFFDNAARTLTYVVTPPTGETGNKSFVGSASFDGVSVAVGGARALSPLPSCTYSLATSSQSFGATSGAGSFNLTATSGCAWNATTNDSWIVITQASGSGNGTVNFSVATNAGSARIGTITVGGQTFTVNQSANAAPTITPAAALARQQGATAATVTVATISDLETGAANLGIATTSVPTGLSVTGLTNTNGTVSAVVTASCQATSGANTIGLKVSDAQGATAQANLTVNVASNPNCFLQISEASGSDQRMGSVLLYSYYSSSISAPALQNTQVRITNTHETLETAVRLYFVDGQFSSVASLFICLPPSQTANFLMSETDPGITGYVVAVAVDKTSGCPTNFNFLTGGAAIKLSAGHTANLPAMAVAALAANPTTCTTGSNVATLNFDGTNYGRLPRMLVLDNLPSVKDGNDTRLLLARIGGSLVNNAGTLGAISGRIYNSSRTAQDFSFSAGTPQLASSFSASFPRLGTRLDMFIPAGQGGWLRLWTDANIGIVGALINLPTNLRTTRSFEGGYNLQHGALSSAVSLDIPISTPTCQ
ncbi:MAG: hypothetical protein JST84_23890 [Acidobacteria bacterium]|nr:hypothetical protein [Acidobacteriota bacterium]